MLITPFIPLVEAWLRADVSLKGTVIHERLVAEHGFTGNYQRVKMFLAEARPRIAAELEASDDNPLTGLHRRFEVVAGAQAQVDWGEEGGLLAHVGIAQVYSFHMVLSHSRDPFTCFTTSMDLATFWQCHRLAFAHFGGVPGQHRLRPHQDRHQTPRRTPGAGAVASGGGGVRRPLRVQHRRARRLPADREGPGRTTSQHRAGPCDRRPDLRLASPTSTARSRPGCRSAGARCTAPTARSSRVRAEPDRAALRSLPDQPYLVTEKHLRRVGRDCLISFDASHYSVPARQIRPGQQVQVQVLPDPAHGDQILIHALAVDGGGWLASHPKAARRGAWQVDPDHWAGLPDGHTRATIVEPVGRSLFGSPAASAVEPLAALLHRRHADTPVAARPLTDYHTIATRS